MRQPALTSTSLSTKSVFTRSELKFSPQWSHHGKIVTCELHDAGGKVLSEDTVQLNVKRESPRRAYGKGKVCVTFSPALQGAHTQGTEKPAQTVASSNLGHAALVFWETDLL